MDWLMTRYGWINIAPLAALGAVPMVLLIARAFA